MAASDRERPYELAADEELAAGLTRVAVGRAERALARLRAAGVGEEDPVEAVHGARKDAKKLRTVLRLLRDELGRKRYRRADARFREAARALASGRDAEAKVVALEALAERRRGLPEGALEAWRGILERDRKAAGARQEEAFAAASAAIEAGLGELRSRDLEGDSWAIVDAALARTYRRGRRSMKAARRHRGEVDFHRWRKRSKDLWHELRLLRAAWPGPLGAAAEEAHRLSDLLGDHHDLAVLRADLRRRRLGAAETAALEAAIGRRQEELAGAALAIGARLYAERPQDFSRRLGRYREAGRRFAPRPGKAPEAG